MKRLVLILFACLLVVCLMAAPSTADALSLAQKVAALQKSVDAIKATSAQQTRQITALQTKVTTQATTIASLTTQLTTATTAIAAIQANKALTLGPYVSVSTDVLNGVRGPHILLTGANLHIRSGSGRTDDDVPYGGGVLSGLGNLIIGYDEPISAGGSGPQPRTGSHCLIVGAEHTWQSYGGLVAGWRNLILAPWASVSGGAGNTASGEYAGVSGGLGNDASGQFSSVSGGVGCEASGESSSVSGGSDVGSSSDRGWAGGTYHTP